MIFTLYKTDTGRIVASGWSGFDITPAADESLLVGEQHREGWIENNTNYLCPAQPSENHVFNWVTKQWEDPRTLQDLKDARNNYINTSRLISNQSHFPHLGKLIAADPLSRSDIDAINGQVNNTGAFPAGFPGAWKCTDNSWLTVASIEEWRALYTSMVNQGTTNFGHAQALKAQLDDATTPEQVEAVVW